MSMDGEGECAIRLKSDSETPELALSSWVSPPQTYLIRKSFAAVEAHGSLMALIFYRRLFEEDPGLRPLFRGDIMVQARKLTEMLGALIGLLDRGDEFHGELEAMGARHADYGVQDSHYAVVGHSLMAMLEEGLGGEFTAEVRAAWEALYREVETAMRRGVDLAAHSSGAR